MNIFRLNVNANKIEENLIYRLLFSVEAERPFLTDENPTIDWNWIQNFAESESIAAVLYPAILKHELDARIPLSVMAFLRNSYFSNLKRYLTASIAMQPVLKSFNKSGISFLVIKGIALAEHVYANPAVRGMSDIDILFRKEDIPGVASILDSCGYRPIDSTPEKALKNPLGYLSSLEYHHQNPLFTAVHVHWHLVNSSVPATFFASRIEMGKIWEDAVPAQICGINCLILSPEHLIIYLCEHALRVGHSFDRLILVLDIDQAIKSNNNHLDWERVVSAAKDWGLSRFVYHSLSIVSHYSGIEIPSAVFGSLRPNPFTILDHVFLKLQTGNLRIRGSSLMVYLADCGGFTNQCMLLFRILFPPAHILHQRQRGQKLHLPILHYLLRMKEVIGHLSEMTAFSFRKLKSKKQNLYCI